MELSTSTTGTSGSPSSFTLKDLEDAKRKLTELDDRWAHKFNEEFAKPRGFDFEAGATMIVSRAFDLSVVPVKYRKRVIVGGDHVAPGTILLFNSSPDIDYASLRYPLSNVLLP